MTLILVPLHVNDFVIVENKSTSSNEPHEEFNDGTLIDLLVKGIQNAK